MDSSQPAPLGQPSPGKPSQTANKRPRWARTDRKAGRPSRKQIAGWLNWYNRLTRSGALADAAEFHRKHGLHRYGATVPTVPTADTATGITETDTRTGSVDTAGHAANPIGPDSAYGSHGGAGGQQRQGRDNWDKTTPPVKNSQCSPLATADAVPLAVEADLTRLAAKAAYTPTVTPPTGESEGDSEKVNTICNGASRFASMWPKVGEAIVGRLCRNKQYNELRVVGEDGRELWTKVGNWLWTGGLIRGERVLVRKIWGSGDDTDAEYEVVKRLDVNEPAEERPVQPPPAPEPLPNAVPAAIPERRTLEAYFPRDAVTTAILPQFQREEPDYPRKQESADDYIARIRAEAAMWANGQGR